MRDNDIVPVGMPDSVAYVVLPGWNGHSEPDRHVGGPRLGFPVLPVYWRPIGHSDTGRWLVEHGPRRASETLGVKGRGRLAMAVSERGGRLDDEVADRLHRFALLCRADIRGERWTLPDGVLLVDPVEVWGPWASWERLARHRPGRVAREVAPLEPTLRGEIVAQARASHDGLAAVTALCGPQAVARARASLPHERFAPVSWSQVAQLCQVAAERALMAHEASPTETVLGKRATGR